MNQPPTDKAMEIRVRAYMTVEAAWHETATGLAESAARQFGHPEWLDDENHWVWELAGEYVPEDPRSFMFFRSAP